jgi:uncharacterized protein YgiM (DUF1202 family)
VFLEDMPVSIIVSNDLENILCFCLLFLFSNCGMMTNIAPFCGAGGVPSGEDVLHSNSKEVYKYRKGVNRMTVRFPSKTILTLALAVMALALVVTGCGNNETATPAPAAVTMAALPTVEPVPAAAGEPTATTITDTYVRTGPGTGYPAYAIAPTGKSAKVLGKSSDGQWYAVALPTQYVGAGYGWVYAANVTVSNLPADLPVYPTNPPPANVPMEPIASGEPQVTALDAVFVRTGPGEIYPAYGIAQAGATGRVIGKSTDGLWWQVALPTDKVGAGNGWVSAMYVSAANVQNVPVVASPPLPPVINVGDVNTSGPYVTCITGVNVRSAPNTDATVYGVAPVGARFQAIGVSSDYQWYQVAIPTNLVTEGNGWVSASYVYAVNTGSLPVTGP